MSQLKVVPSILLRAPFDQFVRHANGCLHFGGYITHGGYGQLGTAVNGTRQVHKALWIELHGPVPDGYDVDHTCHNGSIGCPGGPQCLHRRCFHPDHLEAVTRQVNISRGLVGYAMRTKCLKGLHDITDPANVIVRSNGDRTCRLCQRILNHACQKRRRDAERAARLAVAA